MEEIGYFQAWKLWFAGELELQNHILWGMRLLWIGRLGKFIQVIAALFVIAEIIGPERLKSFRDSLQKVIELKNIVPELRYRITVNGLGKLGQPHRSTGIFCRLIYSGSQMN